MKKLALATAFYTATTFTAVAQTVEENAQELGSQMADLLTMTFTCQHFLGGTSLYRVYKQDMILTMARLTGDESNAVLTADDFEQKLIADAPHDQLRSKVKASDTVIESDVIASCNERIAILTDRVRVLKARLNLL